MDKNIGNELLDIPIGELISQVALAIAESQCALDANSIMTARAMSGISLEDEDGVKQRTEIQVGDNKYTMLELGFTPTFYQFVDTIIEVRIAVNLSHATERTRTSKQKDIGFNVGFLGHKGGIKASTVNATYTSKYNFSAEGSSFIRTKLVPVPPPAGLQALLEKLAAQPPDPPTT